MCMGLGGDVLLACLRAEKEAACLFVFPDLQVHLSQFIPGRKPVPQVPQNLPGLKIDFPANMFLATFPAPRESWE